MSQHFGEHLTIDGYSGKRDLLDSKQVLQGILDTLPGKMGMKKLAEPCVYQAFSNDLKDPGGWTGFVVIAESHISIHTFPLRGFVSADIYTCRNGMDTEFIEAYFKKAFGLEDIETNFIRRGTKYPSSNIF